MTTVVTPTAQALPAYEEAREALLFADRIGLDADVVEARELLVYRVLGRDQAAIVDLVRDVLGPLQHSRSGAAVLLETLLAYFGSGGCRHRGRPAAARIGPHRDVPAGPGRRPDRVQRLAARSAVLAARGRARRPAPRMAGQAAASRPLITPRRSFGP